VPCEDGLWGCGLPAIVCWRGSSGQAKVVITDGSGSIGKRDSPSKTDLSLGARRSVATGIVAG
jgi:hypothetical protein